MQLRARPASKRDRKALAYIRDLPRASQASARQGQKTIFVRVAGRVWLSERDGRDFRIQRWSWNVPLKSCVKKQLKCR